ncbi:MAG: hypothetical protein LBC61_04435 [Candidatus Peribacteria bacterium]|nr:hypothetical protein [Candidatus Peribacteria bacterium]
MKLFKLFFITIFVFSISNLMVFSSYESINKDTIKVYDKIYTEIIKISNKDD